MSILKIRNILKIVSTFMILLSALSLLTSGSFYLIQKVLLNNEAVQGYSLWEFSLYILGYGSSPNVDIGMQLILSVMGIIMISLLSAFLTVNLFRRAKDVLVSRNLAVWKNKNGEYFASILIGNMGRPICNVSVAAQLFDPMGETIDVEDNLHDKPIIIKNHIWRVDYSIKLGSFMYEYFLNKYRGDGILKFYVLISFVDTETGQESIICREYKFEDAVAVSREKGFIYPNYKVNEKDKTGLSRRNSTVWKQFKSIKEDKASREGFCSFMHENIFYIDMKNAVPIIENGDIGAANITQDIRAMAVNLNFNSQDENTAAPGFIMGLIQFLPHRNWGPYYDKN